MGAKKLRLYSTLETDNPKFKKDNGLPRMSYSAYTSWKSDMYRGAFIADKFLGIPDPGNMFTDFGSGCGEYLEAKGMKDEKAETSALLSPSDLETLNKVNLPEGSVFEREIILKRETKFGPYFILGYIDRETQTPECLLDIIDYKTGGAKKSKDYSGSEYNQTRLYAYAREKDGEEIGYVGVELLHRLGNSLVPGDKNVLRLEGTIEEIATPYDVRETEFFLEGFDKVAMEISDNLTFYNKYFAD